MTRAMTSIEHSATELLEVERLTTALSADWLEQHGVLPLRLEGDVLAVGTWRERVDPLALDDLRLLFGVGISLERFSEHDLRTTIRRLYAPEAATAEGLIAGLSGEVRSIDADEIPLDDLLHLANEAPVVRLVNLLLIEALDARASDVHLEAYQDGLRVRYRIVGVLQNAPSPPPHLTAAIISRLKIMAELDIAERRLPQDGRIRLRLANRQVDVRVSTVPTLRGESVVLRLLDKERGRISLLELGMAPDTLELFTEVVSRPHGIVLVTGPTGSGKTTTLYSTLKVLATPDINVCTVEDPIEMVSPEFNQMQVHSAIDLDFATGVRTLLRQDPDIIMIGEIRDLETAQMAVQASLTGHMVLSTLHTNDAPSALTRLLDLGVPNYLIQSTLNGIVAQRLVRTLCPHCKVRISIDADAWNALAGRWNLALPESGFGPKGCLECRKTGFLGRTGIYEMLRISPALRAMIVPAMDLAALTAQARAEGMQPLQASAAAQVARGVTTLAEVAKVLPPVD
jgi:general secretion pathway protein E